MNCLTCPLHFRDENNYMYKQFTDHAINLDMPNPFTNRSRYIHNPLDPNPAEAERKNGRFFHIFSHFYPKMTLYKTKSYQPHVAIQYELGKSGNIWRHSEDKIGTSLVNAPLTLIHGVQWDMINLPYFCGLNLINIATRDRVEHARM